MVASFRPLFIMLEGNKERVIYEQHFSVAVRVLLSGASGETRRTINPVRLSISSNLQTYLSRVRELSVSEAGHPLVYCLGTAFEDYHTVRLIGEYSASRETNTLLQI